MESLHPLMQGTLFLKLGWTLFHFVWQAGAVALPLAIVLKRLSGFSSHLRYTFAGGAMGLMLLLPVLTVVTIDVAEGPIALPERIAVAHPPSPDPTEPAIDTPTGAATEISMEASPRLPWKERIVSAVEPALPSIVILWLAGVCGLSLWHLGGWSQLQRLRRRMTQPVSPALTTRCRDLAHDLGIAKTVALVESALVQVPTVVGHLSPVILLPASALTGLSTDQIEAILLHELAHVKRCDYLVNILQTVVEILGFYHPAVWWVSHQMRIERENCCDDIAVQACCNRISYARALTTMEEIRTGRLSLAVAATGGSLLARIRRLVGRDAGREEKRTWLPSVVALLLIAVLLIPAVLTMARDDETGTHTENERMRVYRVDRKVSDFPAGEDFNTPESAYAAINRVMARNDDEGWLRVSTKRSAQRLATSPKKER